MKTILTKIILLILILGANTCYSQTRNNLRKPVLAGNFYPSSSGELQNALKELFESVKDKSVQNDINAIIVPNKELKKSGKITAETYSLIDPERNFVRVFIIGASHNEKFDGISVYKKSDYRTPLGMVRVDNEVVDRLIIKNNFIKYKSSAHKNEYSVEIQLPYLQFWLKKPFKIVPIIIGTKSVENLDKLAEVLNPYFTSDNLFIISSDISEITDVGSSLSEIITSNSVNDLTEYIATKDKDDESKQIIKSIELSPVYPMLKIASEKPKSKIRKVNDKTIDNGNMSPEYHSYTISNEIITPAKRINLSAEEVQFLLRLVRRTITQKLDDNMLPEIDESELTDNLKLNYGAFVTLTINDEIRGNMGKFTTTEPLYKVVQEMAIASAFRDTRYLPITKKEIGDIDIEISVVTPLKQIFSSDEIQIGKHGIYMTMYGRIGTFLPQVARTTGWNKEEFLGYCSRDRAGFGWDGWRTADLYTFEAFVYNRRDAIRRQ